MKEAIRSLLQNWEHEVAAAREMDAESLKKFNKFLALDFKELWHTSSHVFVVGKEECDLLLQRAGMTRGAVTLSGVVSLEEYDEYIAMVSFRDHQVLGPLLRKGQTEVEVDATKPIEPPKGDDE